MGSRINAGLLAEPAAICARCPINTELHKEEAMSLSRKVNLTPMRRFGGEILEL